MNHIVCQSVAPRRRALFFAAVVLSLAAVLCRCSVAPFASGGNSSQTGNNGIVVAARAQTICGTTHPAARVTVYDQNFMPYRTAPGFCDSAVADSSGRFAISLARDGVFDLLVRDDLQGTSAFIARIPLNATSEFADTVDSLRRPGFLSGRATDTAGRTFAISYVFITGSPFYVVTNNSGDFLLGPLPAGRYSVGFIANFQVIDAEKGQLAPMLVAVEDSSAATIYPGAISQWHW